MNLVCKCMMISEYLRVLFLNIASSLSYRYASPEVQHARSPTHSINTLEQFSKMQNKTGNTLKKN
jgi:hypothetical protein